MEKNEIKKRGNEIKADVRINWVGFEVMENGEKVYVNYWLNQWNGQNELVKMFNQGLNEGVKWLEMWCCVGYEVEKNVKVGNRVFKVNDYEVEKVGCKLKLSMGVKSSGKYEGEKSVVVELLED